MVFFVLFFDFGGGGRGKIESGREVGSWVGDGVSGIVECNCVLGVVVGVVVILLFVFY